VQIWQLVIIVDGDNTNNNLVGIITSTDFANFSENCIGIATVNDYISRSLFTVSIKDRVSTVAHIISEHTITYDKDYSNYGISFPKNNSDHYYHTLKFS
jgi:CBS domain-containing protein